MALLKTVIICKIGRVIIEILLNEHEPISTQCNFGANGNCVPISGENVQYSIPLATLCKFVSALLKWFFEKTVQTTFVGVALGAPRLAML